jgi:hypothetical protein
MSFSNRTYISYSQSVFQKVCSNCSSISEEHSGCSVKGTPALTNTWYSQLQVTTGLVVKVVFIIGSKQVASVLVKQAGIHSV